MKTARISLLDKVQTATISFITIGLGSRFLSLDPRPMKELIVILDLILYLGIFFAVFLMIYYIIFFKFYHGYKYGYTYWQLFSGLEKGLINAGISTNIEKSEDNIIDIPYFRINLDKSLNKGCIYIKNSMKLDIKLDELPISGSLPGKFVVLSSYIMDDYKYYVYEIGTIDLKQEVYTSYKRYYSKCKKYKNDELFITDDLSFKTSSMAITGMTRSGKTYGTIHFLLQLLAHDWEIYIIAPKGGSLYRLGLELFPENTAMEMDDIFNLMVNKISKRVEERTQKYNQKTTGDISIDYRNFGMNGIMVVYDELLASFTYLNEFKKQDRDRFMGVLSRIVVTGAELGVCCCLISQQLSSALLGGSQLRENLMCKVSFNAEEETLRMMFGNVPDIAKRKFEKGQAMFDYSGMTVKGNPRLTWFPKLEFNPITAGKYILKKIGNGLG